MTDFNQKTHDTDVGSHGGQSRQMMEVFENQEFGSIRVLQEAGKTFFCASDVAKALGYVNPYAAVKRHCRGPLTKREGVVQKVNQYGDAGEQVVEISFITEGDVYRLIVHSKLPSAERFEHWVFDEVLPSIRKHGVYMSDSILDQVIQHPEVIYTLAQELVAEREQLEGIRKQLDAEYRKTKSEMQDWLVAQKVVQEILKEDEQKKEQMFLQISMGPGRMRDGKSCSPIPKYKQPDKLTEELTVEEIHTKVNDMIKLAKLAKGWGYDGVEIHGMHWGYLLDQFAMSYTNHRTDEYGGCLENRLRIHKEIVRGIKEACGEDFPVSFRMCIKTFMGGYNKTDLTGEHDVGRNIDEAIEIAKMFESWGVDMLNVNTGTYDTFYYCVSPYYLPKGYNIKYAKLIKEAVNIPVFVAGGMDDPDQCEEAIKKGWIDGATLARASLVDPFYPQKVATGKLEDIRPCMRCTNCIESNLYNGIPLCSANPAAMRELMRPQQTRCVL